MRESSGGLVRISLERKRKRKERTCLPRKQGVRIPRDRSTGRAGRL